MSKHELRQLDLDIYVNVFCDGKDLGEDVPEYTQNIVSSRKLRDKLAETYNWSLDRMGAIPAMFVFTLTQPGVFVSETADTEEMAVALCTAKAFKITVP